MQTSDKKRTVIAIIIAFVTMFIGYFLAYKLYTLVMNR